MDGRVEFSLQWLLGGFLSVLVYMIGGVDHLLIACTIFIILDFFTGVISAAYLTNLESHQMWWGLMRKALLFVFVIVAHQVDIITGNSEGFLRNTMLLFIVGTEGISIIENMGKFGLPMPQFLLSALKKLNYTDEHDKTKK